MKKVFLAALIFATSNAFSQQEQRTKVLFKVDARCSCTVQFARNGTPAGKHFKMLLDSFLIAIDSATTGLYSLWPKRYGVCTSSISPGRGLLSHLWIDGLRTGEAADFPN